MPKNSNVTPTIRLLSVSDLHGKSPWMDWILAQAPSYDAILLPGDLVNGWEADLEPEWTKLGNFFEALGRLGVPCVFCTGNHDARLIPFLQHRNFEISNLFWDGWFLEMQGVRIRAIGYNESLPDKNKGDAIWLYHAPPDNTPVAKGKFRDESFGCSGLEAMALYMHKGLPPVVIGGHQHQPEKWDWTTREKLFLNSGQDLAPEKPKHFILTIEGKELTVRHSDGARTIKHLL